MLENCLSKMEEMQDWSHSQSYQLNLDVQLWQTEVRSGKITTGQSSIFYA